MSGHRGDAEACVAKRRRAIITASIVAVRRRHLAGCQTHWSPPSNSSNQNKGSVRNTDSCNISLGPWKPFHQPKHRGREIFLFFSPHTPCMNIYEYFGGYCIPSCCQCWVNAERVRRAIFFYATFWWHSDSGGLLMDTFSHWALFSSSFSHYSCSDKIFSILPNCIWQEIEKQLQSITPPSVMDVPLRCNFAVAQLRKVQGELSYHL